jgi:hypothetical protein
MQAAHLRLPLPFPPERAAELCRQKVFLRAAGSQLFFFSIPMRVDRGIDREETAVAAVSERYRGDNVFRVKPSRQLVAPRRLLPRIRGRFPSMKAPVTPACLKEQKSHKIFMIWRLQHFLRAYSSLQISV